MHVWEGYSIQFIYLSVILTHNSRSFEDDSLWKIEKHIKIIVLDNLSYDRKLMLVVPHLPIVTR